MEDLTVVANILKVGADNYTLSIRWLLGQNGDKSDAKLPWKDDIFQTVIRTRNGRILQANKTLAQPSDPPHAFLVSPQTEVMLDPPKVRTEVPGSTGQVGRFFSRKPSAPVAEDDVIRDDEGQWKLKPGKGMGLVHLLTHADAVKNEQDRRNEIELALKVAQDDIATKARNAEYGISNSLRSDIAEALSKLFGTPGVRPEEYKPQFAKVQHALTEAANSGTLLKGTGAKSVEMLLDFVKGQTPAIRSLGLKRAKKPADIFVGVALIMALVNDDKFLKVMESLGFNPDQIRRQLKLKALQGGKLIDFWASSGADKDRGKIAPAFEILGQGIDIKNIPAATIDDIKSEHSNYFIEITTSDANGRYETSKTFLFAKDFEEAESTGAAFHAFPPISVNLNYDLTRSDEYFPAESKTTNTADEPTFKTGNGIVELHIFPKHPQYDPRDECGAIVENEAKVATETAFNVYGIWEGDQAVKKYFDDPELTPKLNELRPYLITRRYSFERDLYGAFPDIADKPHPQIKDHLATPPWEAVMRRPESVQDFNDYNPGDDVELPVLPGEVPDPFYGGKEGPTIFSIDLRTGLKPIYAPPPGLADGWDPGTEVDFDWNPIERRGDADNLDQPQGYRFFVTSVNCFDQESDAIPVQAADPDTDDDEQWVYRPQYRTQIRPTESVDLVEKTASGRTNLEISFKLPKQPTEFGIHKALKAFEDQGHSLEATVRVYRRRLVQAKENGSDPNGSSRETEEVSLQWRGLHTQLALRGWKKFSEDTLSVSADGGDFVRSVALEYKDRGFEFLAAVSVAIPEEASAFWSLGTDARTMFQASENENGDPIVKLYPALDAPAYSTVATSKAFAFAVPKDHVPRHVFNEVLSGSLADALPVLPIPGVQRDTILARIATAQTQTPSAETESRALTLPNSGSSAPEIWKDTPFALSYGQRVSAEAALTRTLPNLANIADIDSPLLKETRYLLAQSFHSFAEKPGTSDLDHELGRHPSVGFRGAMRLSWSYLPHRVEPPADAEAEATTFEIFQMRLPQDDAERARQLAVLPPSVSPEGATQVTEVGYITDLFLPQETEERNDRRQAYDEILQQMTQGALPLCALFVEDDTKDMYPSIITQVTQNGSSITITATPLNHSLGSGQGQLLIFAGTSAVRVSTKGLDEPYEPDTANDDNTVPHSVYLPVPGGEAEYGIWWIVSRSSQETSTPFLGAPIHFEKLSPTVEPESVVRVETFAPFDRLRHWVNPATHSKWLPTDIADQSDAQSNPRLVIQWNEPVSDDLFLIVCRQERQVGSDDKDRPAPKTIEITPYQAIEHIGSLQDGEPLEGRYIAALLKENAAWLLGEEIEYDDDGVTKGEPLITADMGLSASSGLPTPPNVSDASDPDLKTFMDYFQSINSPTGAMDGSLEYRYQLQFAREISGAQNPQGGRFLLSRATTWTEWKVPEAPPVVAYWNAGSEAASDTLFTPTVEFRVSANPSWAGGRVKQGRDILQTLDWEYDVVIRRRIRAMTPGEEGSDLFDIEPEVGFALKVRPDGTPAVMKDDRIERKFENEALSVIYDVYVAQSAIRDGGDGPEIQKVRSFEGIPTLPERVVGIRAPSPAEFAAGKEVMRVVHIEIK